MGNSLRKNNIYNDANSSDGYLDENMKNTYLMDEKNRKYDNVVTSKNDLLNELYGKYKNIYYYDSSNNIRIKDIADNEKDSINTKYNQFVTSYNAFSSLPTPTSGFSDLINTSDGVQAKRLKMDADISRLNSTKNMSNNNDTSILYNAYFYINILWIILATTLIYYIFTEI